MTIESIFRSEKPTGYPDALAHIEGIGRGSANVRVVGSPWFGSIHFIAIDAQTRATVKLSTSVAQLSLNGAQPNGILSVASLGDIDSNGTADVGIGSRCNSTSVSNAKGALWILKMTETE